MTEVRILLSTIDSEDRAEQIARTLIEERKVACVNILPGLTSVYHWNGALEHSSEHLLIIKTTSDKVETTVNRLKDIHPYEVPEIIVLDVVDGLPSYLEWVVSETRRPAR